MKPTYIFFLLLLMVLTACAAPVTPSAQAPALPSATSRPDILPPSATPATPPASPIVEATAHPTLATAPTLRPTRNPDDWQTLPVIPTLSERAREIYQRGLELGNNPRAFSKIGDCDATTTWFLGDFDLGPRHYSLGEYAPLQETIDYFHGSFGRDSVAVRRGFNTASVLSVLWADRAQCEKNETPLECELRLHQPSLALLLLGTNDIHRPEQFEPNLRKIIEQLIEKGVLPILTTKADNLEGDHRINQIIVAVADEYELPVWNYWKAVQPLPNQGLQEDKAHLTFASNKFDNPLNMQAAWPWRNLTALQTLDAVRKGMGE